MRGREGKRREIGFLGEGFLLAVVSCKGIFGGASVLTMLLRKKRLQLNIVNETVSG